MSKSKKYRIEATDDLGWCIVRNHDDDLMSIYDTKKDALAALSEYNAFDQQSDDERADHAAEVASGLRKPGTTFSSFAQSHGGTSVTEAMQDRADRAARDYERLRL